MKKLGSILFLGLISWAGFSQGNNQEYVKKVLETPEVELLYSYYSQDGNNAAVTGGEGTEKLTDMTPTIIVSIPLGEDNVLTLDAGISAYTSASSSNINPFDGNKTASPWVESSGASKSDALTYFHPTFTHSSKNRNNILSGNIAISAEYDYFSVGFGGGYTHLMNEKNTELGISAQVYLDTYKPQYPIELREGFFDDRISGTGTYSPLFNEFNHLNRNSYSLSLNFSQIITKRFQASLSLDFVLQDGLLSTPHQRVYLQDRNNFFIENFQLADNVELLPTSRFKLPIGGRLSYYLNDLMSLRAYFRYYYDDWGVSAYTASLEIPIKISEKFTVFPMYRYYTQTASDYFYPKETALSTYEYYTSDYDLSEFNSNQYGFGITYKDIFTQSKVWKFGLKSISFRFNQYERTTGLSASIFELGAKFIMD
ncbi:DUF3570 domain-containing protein [Arenibacter sp. M-2]|uniref:DUF3570 domain-containing protein n=1 Tax=Arenibacter sp. M-2 TaxID=3053612 RepID=UPI0025711CB1|nr:DUF3570 domain-containing protein [Arenibacter sp. M-2]MDL5513345.1 DUF3570 domain-containing protein [Arenibacter sp. M-2]